VFSKRVSYILLPTWWKVIFKYFYNIALLNNSKIEVLKMNTYFKSLVTMEHSPVTTTYDSETNSRRTCQTLQEILDTNTIKPNTTHSQLKKRLCVSLIDTGYKGVYRPEGLVFETEERPDYAVPFDLMALTSGVSFTSADYNHGFLNGSEKFKYGSIDEMLGDYPDSEKAIRDLNAFRRQNGLKPVDAKTMNYTECCFERDVPIRPVAIIGRSSTYHELAKKYGIWACETFEEFSKPSPASLYDFTRKSIMGAIFRVASSFAIDGAAYMAVTGGELNKFFERFQWDKFLTVTAAVVAINFVDYKFDITNKLDRLAKAVIDRIKSF
jgi:hypothetical protein